MNTSDKIKALVDKRTDGWSVKDYMRFVEQEMFVMYDPEEIDEMYVDEFGGE